MALLLQAGQTRSGLVIGLVEYSKTVKTFSSSTCWVLSRISMKRSVTNAHSEEERLLSEVVYETDWTGRGKKTKVCSVILCRCH